MKFDFSKSDNADFRNKLQLQLQILMKNVLYITHEVDQIKKIVTATANTFALQKQVDDYFEEDDEQKAEQVPEGT